MSISGKKRFGVWINSSTIFGMVIIETDDANKAIEAFEAAYSEVSLISSEIWCFDRKLHKRLYHALPGHRTF